MEGLRVYRGAVRKPATDQAPTGRSLSWTEPTSSLSSAGADRIAGAYSGSTKAGHRPRRTDGVGQVRRPGVAGLSLVGRTRPDADTSHLPVG